MASTSSIIEATKVSKNLKKIAELFWEPVVTVFLNVLNWLYVHKPDPLENFIDHYDEVFLKKKRGFFDGEIQNLKDKSSVKEFDITILSKMIKLSADLTDWNPQSQDTIEAIIISLTKGRNVPMHRCKEINNLTIAELEQKCNDLCVDLETVLIKAATKANIPQTEYDEAIRLVKKRVNEIQLGYDKETLVQAIYVDLKKKYGEELKKKFKNELRGYCPQKFCSKDQEITTKDLLQECSDSGILVIGESGMGKSTYTLYVQYSYVIGHASEVNYLEEFDVVFRIACRATISSDIKRFMEVELPTAHKAMPDTESLKKTLNELKVLWILDGFDERNRNFNDFYKSLTTDFSKNHKIILTSRKDSINDIPQTNITDLANVSIQTFTENEAKDVASKFLKTNLDEFKKDFDLMDEEKRKIIKTPYYLNITLMLWERNQNVMKEDFSVYSMIEKILDLEKEDLRKRLEDNLNMNKRAILNKINNWFKESLCKVAASGLFIYESYSIDEIDKEQLENDSSTLIDNYCLSAFLDCDSSSFDFSYRHRSQQEFLAYLYIKDMKRQQLEEFFEGIRLREYDIDHIPYHLRYLKGLNVDLYFRCSKIYFHASRDGIIDNELFTDPLLLLSSSKTNKREMKFQNAMFNDKFDKMTENERKKFFQFLESEAIHCSEPMHLLIFNTDFAKYIPSGIKSIEIYLCFDHYGYSSYQKNLIKSFKKCSECNDYLRDKMNTVITFGATDRSINELIEKAKKIYNADEDLKLLKDLQNDLKFESYIIKRNEIYNEMLLEIQEIKQKCQSLNVHLFCDFSEYKSLNAMQSTNLKSVLLDNVELDFITKENLKRMFTFTKRLSIHMDLDCDVFSILKKLSTLNLSDCMIDSFDLYYDTSSSCDSILKKIREWNKIEVCSTAVDFVTGCEEGECKALESVNNLHVQGIIIYNPMKCHLINLINCTTLESIILSLVKVKTIENVEKIFSIWKQIKQENLEEIKIYIKTYQFEFVCENLKPEMKDKCSLSLEFDDKDEFEIFVHSELWEKRRENFKEIGVAFNDIYNNIYIVAYLKRYFENFNNPNQLFCFHKIPEFPTDFMFIRIKQDKIK